MASPAFAQSFGFSDPTSSSSISGSYPAFTITGPNGGHQGTARYSGVFVQAGTISFSWIYHTDDCDGPSYDPAGYSLDGGDSQLSNSDGARDQSGASKIAIGAGHTFGWYVHATDGICGAGNITISSSFTPDFDPNAASRAAQSFVATRQQLLMDAFNFPSIFDRGPNGVRVQTDPNGVVDALAFSASSALRLTSAERALTRAALGHIAGPKGGDATHTGDLSFWIDGQMGLHADGGNSGEFAVATMGVDKLVTDRVLIGFAIEGDWVTAPTASSDIVGLGLMIGPYASVAIAKNLAVSAHILVGRSWNSQSASQSGGIYTGIFETARVEAGASLAGEFTADLLTVTPDVSFSLMSESTGDYALSGPGGLQTVPGFLVSTYQLSAGSGVAYRLDQGNGIVFVPRVALRLGLDAGLTTSAFALGSLGVMIQTDAGLSLDIAFQSRTSSDGFRTVAARASVGGHF